MGSPDVRQIDGLGGADTLTSKGRDRVPKSTRPGSMSIICSRRRYRASRWSTPILRWQHAGRARPFAIETGLFPAQDGETHVISTRQHRGAHRAIVQTPGRQMQYRRRCAHDGVPGTAAPIVLNFMDVVGSISASCCRPANTRDVIDGIEVTCIDVAMPMIMMAREGFRADGLRRPRGNQSEQGAVRPYRADPPRGRKAHGLRDVSDKVIPKVGLLSPPRDGGTLRRATLTPHALHAAQRPSPARSASRPPAR